MITGITTGPVTLDELNAQVKHANEVRYERNAVTAAAWIETAKATEERNGRPNTTFRCDKIGRRVVVFVDRSRN